MWLQVQEMVYIEKGGAEQIPGELEAYNPLIPNGPGTHRHLHDRNRRSDPPASASSTRWAVSRRPRSFASVTKPSPGRPKPIRIVRRADGKASSVQFVHFPFTPTQIVAFRNPATEVVLGFAHPNYRHMTVLADEVRTELSGDFA